LHRIKRETGFKPLLSKRNLYRYDEARQMVEHVSKGRQIMVTGRLKAGGWPSRIQL
jgi:single-stranded DNA-binding protein